MRILMYRLCALALLFNVFAASAAHGQPQADAAFTELFYASGGLRIQAYLYKPAGDGPFPVVVYNHGSRIGRERVSAPHQHIGTMLTRAGYAVLVPERRGYGNSEGDEVGLGLSSLVAALQAETDDVLAAIEYLKAQAFIDSKRMGIMGWSFGGIITMFAISRSNAFSVAVNQAGAALTWDRRPEVRSALVSAAEKADTPTLFMVAKNDRTTASITTLADIYNRRGLAHRTMIYEPFVPPSGSRSDAPGHALFGSQAVHLWEHDVVGFLNRYLRADTHDKRDSPGTGP